MDDRPKYLTFVHRFSAKVKCSVRVKDQAPARGEDFSLVMEWCGRPKPKHLAAYRQWALFVHQTLADRWGERILYALGVSANQTELWSFEPGQAPKLTKKLDVGIP